MNWEQKLQAIASLGGGKDGALRMGNPGEWHCHVPADMGGDGYVTSVSGHGATPEASVDDAWQRITTLPSGCHLRLHNDRKVRWNGFMFEDVK